MTLYLELKNKCQEVPNASAIIEKETTYDYETLLNDIDKASSCLNQFGISKFDHVGFLCLNQYEYVQMLFACNKLGAVAVPINAMQTDSVIEYCINDAAISMLFVSYELVSKLKSILPQIASNNIKVIIIGGKLQDYPQLLSFEEFLSLPYNDIEVFNEPDTPAVMLYTSGTTALPKGVLLSNENLIANVKGFCQITKLPKFAKAILALPLFHSFGQIVLLVCLFEHITTILFSQFQPASILKLLVSYKAEVLPLVPTMFNVLMTASIKKEISLDFVKFCITGGATIPYTLHEKLKQATSACIINGYGLTETSPVYINF